MPPLTLNAPEKFEIEWDSDSDVDAKEKLDKSNKSRHTTILAGKHLTSAGRLIAGHKRTMTARMNAQNARKGASQVLQSITASPALCHTSFEELRLDCYMQSKIAKGTPPAPVDALAMPWAIIPPLFKEFREEDFDIQSNDVVMTQD